MAAATGRCFSGGASVPAPTDVAEGRNNFEQPFSAFGQPGPRFDQHLESIDAKKKRGNKNHRNFANGIANLDSKAAQQERQEVLGYRTWRIFTLHLCCSIGLPRAPSPPLNQCWGWGCAFEYFFPWALTASSSTLIARGCGGDRVRGRQMLAETAQKYFENIFHVLKD